MFVCMTDDSKSIFTTNSLIISRKWTLRTSYLFFFKLFSWCIIIFYLIPNELEIFFKNINKNFPLLGLNLEIPEKFSCLKWQWDENFQETNGREKITSHLWWNLLKKFLQIKYEYHSWCEHFSESFIIFSNKNGQ